MSTGKGQVFKFNKSGHIPEEWSIKEFKDIADIDKNSLSSDTNPDYKFQYISLSDIDDHGQIEVATEQIFKSAPSRARRIVKEGDILMSTVRPNLQGFTMIKSPVEDLVASTGFAVISPKSCDPEYLFHYLYDDQLSRQLHQLLVGSNYPAINSSDVKKLKIPLPPPLEQARISKILSTWDKAINNQWKTLVLLKSRKKGLMQQVFKGTLRLKGKNGIEYPEWKPKKLSHYLKVSKAKNEDLKYTEDDVLSVSGEYGIVNQIEFHGRSFAGASVANYGVVEVGDIVYTKSPLKANPYGIIKVNKVQAGIVSTLYAIYKCKPTVNGEFVDYYFQLDDNVNRYLRPLVQKGTKNDMKINNEKVLIDEVLFPSLEEQNAIVDFFKTIDNEIIQTKEYLESLKKQKKGLMQKLLTGEIRVKTE